MSSPVEILVVEDSPTQAMQLRTLLERQGYTVRIATNGAAALDSVSRTHPPTVVLADVLLPLLDGYEVCRLIKADPSLKEIPVILLTMLSEPKEIIRGMQCGADNFLVKPCDEKKLLAGIRDVLVNRELRHHPASRIGMEVLFAGERHVISADRVQMLDLLLASYEAAAENAEKLRKAREAAERANREKSELLARLGQEFRAPLNAILGFAQLLEVEKHGEVNDARIREILGNGGKLLKIADKMLDIARMDAGDLSIAEELVDWREVVIWCGDLIRPLAAEKSVEISYRLGGEGFPRIIANRDRLSEVLLILLSNAVKFNQQGGRVSVSAENLPESTALRISIADTGMGIPAAKMNLLFIPFERLGVERRGIEGVGIGLALARRLVKAMCGALNVESVEGRGSTFSIDLPVEQNGPTAKRNRRVQT